MKLSFNPLAIINIYIPYIFQKSGKTMKLFNGKKYWEVYQEEIKKFAIENLEKTTTIEIDNGETI